MRSETIRVKKPVWVRIVNPEPIVILDTTWSYGSVVLLKPGGVFRTISDRGWRTLAAYQPPHMPSDPHDAPPDAFVLHTSADLRLMAEGQLGYEEPYDSPLCGWSWMASSGRVHPGDRARVPKTRLVRVRTEPIDFMSTSGGPYRGSPATFLPRRLSERRPIRPGGTMTVHAVEGAMLRVTYRADPSYRGEQCETGAWFYVLEAEFLRMEEEYVRLKELEGLERAMVISLLGSL